MKTYADRKRRPRRSEPPASSADAPRGFADLHRAVGNRAVGHILGAPGGAQVLQRWFGGWRLPVPAAPEAKATATCMIEGGGFEKGTTFRIEAFHWGVQTGGPTSAKDFSVVRHTDDLSAKLFEAAAEGTRIGNVTIAFARGSTTARYVFYDVYVSAVRPGGGGGDPPAGRGPVQLRGRQLRHGSRGTSGRHVRTRLVALRPAWLVGDRHLGSTRPSGRRRARTAPGRSAGL